jgi:hypothetical protein
MSESERKTNKVKKMRDEKFDALPLDSELRPRPFILNEQGREFIKANQIFRTYQYQALILMLKAMGIPLDILKQANEGNSRRQMDYLF